MPRKKKPQTLPVVHKVAQMLRREIARCNDGDFLGTEGDLMKRLEVSRPTFRQAAKLLEHEQMLRIRRGIGGGFFARIPTASAVSHMVAVFLQARNSTQEQAFRAGKPILIETARLAAAHRDTAALEKLKEFLAKDREFSSNTIDKDVLFRREVEFGEALAPSSGNPVLELFLSVMFNFITTFVRSVYVDDPERVATYRDLRNKMIAAIIDGDEEVAGLMALRRWEVLMEWFEKDGGLAEETRSGRESRIAVAAWSGSAV